jgi:hypothetical protein
MKLYLRQIGAAALAIAISVAAQRGTARIVLAAGQSSPINTGQGQTPDSGGPSLKETSDWLKSNLEAYGGGCFNDTYYQKISDVSIDNSCKLSYKDALIKNSNNKIFLQRAYSIPLGAVSDIQLSSSGSPGTGCADGWLIEVNTGNIAVVTSNGGSPMPVARININNQPSMSVGGVVPQSPAQMAPRIQKAIQRAVNLCRGSFKAPPQAHEPF